MFYHNNSHNHIDHQRATSAVGRQWPLLTRDTTVASPAVEHVRPRVSQDYIEDYVMGAGVQDENFRGLSVFGLISINQVAGRRARLVSTT